MKTEDNRLNFLIVEIDARIKSFSGRKDFYRKRAFTSFIGVTILSTISTVILGFQLKGQYIIGVSVEQITRIIALVVSSTITVISSYNAFFDHKELWINNQNTLNQLKSLKFEINFSQNSNFEIKESELIQWKDAYQKILSEANSKWEQYRLDNN